MSFGDEIADETNELASQNGSRDCLVESPLASIRIDNPNLHPIPEPEEPIGATKKPGPRRRKPEFPIPTELSTSSSLNSMDISPQHFWKFHLLKFGGDMYLTTNPTPRHLCCRSFPGYYIGVEGNLADYTLTFEEIETGKTYLKIRRQISRQGHTFRFKLRRLRYIKDGKIVERSNTPDVYENTLRREEIPKVLMPSYPDYPMTSYHTQDFHGQKWSVGSIPRVRESRMNSDELKLVAKQNVYFHANFAGHFTLPMFTVPPVRAVFRPSEASARKRMMRSINRLLNIDNGESKVRPEHLDASVLSGVKYYYKAGDGLYGEANPPDDDPNKHSKHGWLTVFDDEDLFLQPGMFDLVVGLVVGVSYERLIDL